MNDNGRAVKTLRLKVKRESYEWLNAAAIEVNQVWNWANETSEKAIRRYAGRPKWLSGYDLNSLSAGASKYFLRISADTIQKINCEFAAKRKAEKATRLRWRRSGGSRRSLGWVPFKAINLRRHGSGIRFCGKTIRVFEQAKLADARWRDGQFAQDAVGDWWLCLPIYVEATDVPAPHEVVGIDLGLKDTAITSDGSKLDAGRYYRDTEDRVAQAQRRGHKRHAKRLLRKVARQRKDALHKFTTAIVRKYQNIVVGDVSSSRLAKTKMAKAVNDSGWYMLKQMLQYKGQRAGRTVEIVNEAYTSRTCSSCGSISGPKGVIGLRVRAWQCMDCGADHDRDINAAKNIAMLGSRRSTSVDGNESFRSARKRVEVTARSSGAAGRVSNAP